MKKWTMLVLLQVLSLALGAGEGTTVNTNESSAIVYLLIGLFVLIAAAYILYKGQKRRFNY
ncbi:MAG: LPXTG cell wall anchor domain-containing protein [Sphingobacterium sp.]